MLAVSIESSKLFYFSLKLAMDPSTPSSSGLRMGPYVHLMYALPKDVALLGLWVSVLYLDNPNIQLPLQQLND
jgi:hypothetical protein